MPPRISLADMCLNRLSYNYLTTLPKQFSLMTWLSTSDWATRVQQSMMDCSYIKPYYSSHLYSTPFCSDQRSLLVPRK